MSSLSSGLAVTSFITVARLEMRFSSILGAVAGLVATVQAQSNSSAPQVNSTFSPARPPAIPLAVKNPYLSVWLPAGSKGSGLLPGQWPSFYTLVTIPKQNSGTIANN